MTGLRTPTTAPRSRAAACPLQASDQLDALVEDVLLLLRASCATGSRGCSRAARSRGPASATAFICSGNVSIECPGTNQVVLMSVALEQLEQPRRADLAGEHAARDVDGRVLAAIRAEPARDRVDVDPERDEDLLGHRLDPRRGRGRQAEEAPAVGQHVAEAPDDLVKGGGVGDERRRDLQDGLAAIVGAGDQPRLDQSLGQEALASARSRSSASRLRSGSSLTSSIAQKNPAPAGVGDHGQVAQLASLRREVALERADVLVDSSRSKISTLASASAPAAGARRT